MPYTAPHTITTGELVTPTTMNNEWGGNVSFLANPPACRVYNNAAQSVASATFTALAFNSERFDTDNMHDTVTNNSRITINTAGLYVVTGHVEWAANTTSERIVEFLVNGTNEVAVQRQSANTTGGAHLFSITTMLKLAATDYIQLRVYQATGGALNVQPSNSTTDWFSCDFGAVWVGLG